jgi:HAD superfamily hydrolase (TIGR01490 family)
VYFFDVDYTLVRKSTTHYFIWESLREKVFRLKDFAAIPGELLRYRLGKVRQDFIEKALEKMAGIPIEKINRVAENCFERYVKGNLYTEGLKMIKELLGKNERVLFVSSAFINQLEPLMAFYGVKEALASRFEVQGGLTTGRCIGKPLFGHNKLEAAKLWLRENKVDPSQVSFYSDSYTDLPLLSYVGRPIAVNPDHFLSREVRCRRWESLRWTETLE